MFKRIAALFKRRAPAAPQPAIKSPGITCKDFPLLGWEMVNGHGRWRIITNPTDQILVSAVAPLPPPPPQIEQRCRFTYHKVAEADGVEVLAVRCERCGWHSSVRCENGASTYKAQQYLDYAAFRHHLGTCAVRLGFELGDKLTVPLQINGTIVGELTQEQAAQLSSNWVDKSIDVIPQKLINIKTRSH